MADKKISIEIEDKTPGGGASTPGGKPGAASQAQDKELEKLAALWKKQDEQDKRELEKLFIESNKKLWERQDREEQQRENSAAYERALELDATKDSIVKDLIASFDDITRADQNESSLLGMESSNLEADIEAATQELLNMVDGTKQATSWLESFASMLGQSASSAAAALGGGLGGGGGGHGAKAGVFGAFGGGSAGISVGHSLTASALNAGGALAVLTAASLAYVKVVDKLAEMTGGMSGEVALAQAQGDIQKIQDELRLAQEQGPQIAGLVEQSNAIMHEARAIVRETLDLFGGMLEGIGSLIRRALTGIEVIISILNAIKDWFADRWRELWAILENIPLVGAAIRKAEEFFTNRAIDGADDLQNSIDAIFFGNQQEIDKTNKRRGMTAAGGFPDNPVI